MSRRDRDLGDARRAHRDSMNYLKSQRDQGGSRASGPRNVTNTLIQAAEVGAGAAAVGYLAGRMGTTSLGSTGIPLGLAIGVGGHLLAMFGGNFGQKYGSHLQNVSNGALAAWFTTWGAGMGGQARVDAAGGGEALFAPPRPALVAGAPAYPAPAIGVQHPHDLVGMAPAYPMPARAPLMMNAPNPWAGQHIPFGARQAVQPAPLSEAELQAMSRDMG